MEKLYKLVNGVKVELNEEEYLQRAIDQEAHEAKLVQIELNKYKELRKKEYGSIEDQLDMIYHSGFYAWEAHIKAIKDKYPKPE